MVDTVRSLSSLQTLLATNGAGAISAQDIRDLLVSTYLNSDQARLENGKTTVDTPDDEFSSGTLDGKWTVVDGGSGTVNLLATSTTGIYDLATRSGTMLIQSTISNELALRQDYTLPDGNSIIMSCSFGYNQNGSPANSEANLRLCINNSDTTPQSGNYEDFGILVFGGVVFINVWNGSAAIQDQHSLLPFDNRIYLRISRSSLDYSFFWSTGGTVWLPVGTRTAGSAYNNVWIGSFGLGNTTSPPIATQAIHWIRLGSNSYDPW